MAAHIPNYLLIGSGRLAIHLRYYLSTLEIPIAHWSRSAESPPSAAGTGHENEMRLRRMAGHAEVVLLAIADDALPEWVVKPEFSGRTVVHFSGARSFDGAWGFHPLMTFSRRLYEPEFYRDIPFVAERGFPHHSIFPFLTNPVYEINPKDKALYHALCHMAANFPPLIWVEVIRKFEQNLHLPASILEPILRRAMTNTLVDGERALTGPLVRNDLDVIGLHRKAIAADSQLARIYAALTKPVEESI